ncbi:MAG: glycosyltransferase family 39 protein [Verrucomicrobia bacterium]|nr:glycosyltransferase family 39 protein [Verrucomicrobiota bacterium]MDA1065614.1 glycosyltransferase family 39 protein [Verrucomicrobiota bacterium]
MSFFRSFSFRQIAPWAVVVFFVLKAIITSIWIVRPWDIPDEVGHYSYIKDLATGKGLAVLHETLLDVEVWKMFAPDHPPSPGTNWIAQHPPLYHFLMVPVYWLGAMFGSPVWGPFFLIRAVTSVFFGLGLFVLMKVLREVGLNPGAALGVGIMVGSIPNHTYLAGGVNHDALVFLFGCLVLLFWIRYSLKGELSDLTKLGIALGIGGVVKYTFLVLFPPILALSLITIWRNGSDAWKHSIRILLLSTLPIGFWIMRNLFVYGQMLPIDMTGFVSDEPLNISLLEFGRAFPIFSILMQSFWGLLGWMGDGVIKVRWLQIYTIYQEAFTYPLIGLFLLSLFYTVKNGIGSWKRLLWGVDRTLIAVVLLFVSDWLDQEYTQYWILIVIGTIALSWRISDHFFGYVNNEKDREGGIEMGALVIFFFFLIVHILKVYSFTVSSGALQGTFGRYYLPVLGFAIVGFFAFGLRKCPWAAQLVLGFGILYSCVELYIWLHEAIPFFSVYG